MALGLWAPGRLGPGPWVLGHWALGSLGPGPLGPGPLAQVKSSASISLTLANSGKVIRRNSTKPYFLSYKPHETLEIFWQVEIATNGCGCKFNFPDNFQRLVWFIQKTMKIAGRRKSCRKWHQVVQEWPDLARNRCPGLFSSARAIRRVKINKF